MEEHVNPAWQAVSVTVAVLDANRTGTVQHLNDQNSLSPQRGFMVLLGHTAPTPTLHPTTKAFSLFIRMIMGQKPERAPCLSTITCGDGFVAMSCMSIEAQCAALVQKRQSRTEDRKQT